MTFKDLSIGMTYQIVKSFSQDDVKAFAVLSMDNNPIHLDKEYAQNSLFKKNIVHGFLVGSLFSAIIGTKMPGEGSIYLNQTMVFRKPVFWNQSVRAVVTVEELFPEKQRVLLSTNCYDDDGNIFIEGTALVKVI
jgi:3-hydroxybutyryl-CoA dehydratase